jgi:DNA-binding CsgD family transcriptional regulator
LFGYFLRVLTLGDTAEYLASATIAMGVLDTRSLTVTAANMAFAELLGRDLDVTIGLRLDDYLEGDRLTTSKTVVDALRRGWMDSCEGEAEFLLGDGTVASTFTWSIPLGTEPPHDALLMGAAPVRTARPPGFEAHRLDPTMIVLGALDHDWCFTDLSVQAVDRLGWPSGQEGRLRVQDIVHPADVPVVLTLLGRVAVGKDATTIYVRVKGQAEEWLPACISVSALYTEASPRFGIAITFLAEDRGRHLERADDLEEELWRLTADVRARLTNVVSEPDPPEVSGLTERQSEIVRRLLDGQRVQGIARDLFLSPSTVRNHLSATYQKFGVTSQSELIEKLRAPRNGDR